LRAFLSQHFPDGLRKDRPLRIFAVGDRRVAKEKATFEHPATLAQTTNHGIQKNLNYNIKKTNPIQKHKTMNYTHITVSLTNKGAQNFAEAITNGCMIKYKLKSDSSPSIIFTQQDSYNTIYI